MPKTHKTTNILVAKLYQNVWPGSLIQAIKYYALTEKLHSLLGNMNAVKEFVIRENAHRNISASLNSKKLSSNAWSFIRKRIKNLCNWYYQINNKV